MAQLNDLIVTGASRLLNGLGILGSTNADSIFPNVTDTYALGSSDKRWNSLYAKTSNIDTETVRTLTVTNYATIGANQSATGTGTGALRVSGGISATQNSWFGGNITTTKNISATGSGSFGGTLSAATTVNINGDWETDFGLYLQEGSSNGQYGAYFLYGVNDTLKIGTMNNNDKVTAITIGRGSSNVSIAGTVTAPTFSGALSGNATTATTLKTARTLTIGNTGKSFNGSANVSWTIAEIGAVNKTGDTMTGMLTINKTQTAAVFGGSVSNISSGAYNPTAGIQICAAAGGATNSTAIGFHNPGISSASIGYYNTDANTGQFKFLSDDATWSVNIGTTVTASLFSGQAEGHRIGYRHLDAGNPNSWNDSRLYIGYGSMYPTRSIGFYNTNSANTGNTLWAEINDNGLYACTRFGVNGQNTSYNFYVNGTSRFNNKVYIGTTARTNELIISGAFTDTTLGTQDGNDRPSLKITGNYPQIVLMAGGANNANHGATLSFASYDTGTATSGAFKSFTMGTQGYNANAFDIGFGTSTNPHTNCMNFSGGNPIMRLESSRRVWHYGISSFCNHSANASYTDAAIQIREVGYGGSQTGSWGEAPRLAWHWSGRVQTQIGLGSNGELYVSGNQFSNAYRLMYENGGTWGISINGNSGSSTRTTYQGNHAETASSTTANSPTAGMLYSSGLYLTGTYTDSNTPCNYGNIINAAGAGSGQLLLEWSGSDNTTGRIFYRSHRDTSTGGWGDWKQVWMQGNSVTGAVWNDYAECREADIQEAGYVMIEKGDDTLTKSTERMQPFAGVSSDTWGFSQGETERAKTHIAVAGRALVYPYRPRDEYKPGDCVCAAPNGTVDIMTPNEVALHPDRIVGTVSCVPNYETWGGGELADRDPVQVNGRIWIKVR